MGGQGAVTLTGRLDGDAQLELAVADTGPGIPEADRNRVFDPFFTTKEPGRGTGLGLSISRSIAEAYGGQLTLAPPSTSGATLLVRLPAWRA
jgi:two-component system NtrC family sensor kinase